LISQDSSVELMPFSFQKGDYENGRPKTKTRCANIRRPLWYINLLTSGKLQEHLMEIDREANDRLETMMKQAAEAQGITEALKATNQMAWVGAMNNIKRAAEEVIFKELVYV